MKLPLVVLLLSSSVAAAPAWAISAADDAAERQRIAAEQAQVEQAYAARQAECRTRFIVTSCLDAARRDRREAMEKLRQQEVVLDEAQRKQRAAERIDEIRAKVSADEGKRREAEARVQAREARRQEEAAAALASVASAPSAAVSAPARARVAPAKRPVDTAAAASAYDQRQRDAQEHRAAVERRNAERARKSKPSRPLPPPASGSSSKLEPPLGGGWGSGA
jgi:hypothetical protein